MLDLDIHDRAALHCEQVILFAYPTPVHYPTDLFLEDAIQPDACASAAFFLLMRSSASASSGELVMPSLFSGAILLLAYCIIWDELHNVVHVATKGSANFAQGVHLNRFVSSHLRHSIRSDARQLYKLGLLKSSIYK